MDCVGRTSGGAGREKCDQDELRSIEGGVIR